MPFGIPLGLITRCDICHFSSLGSTTERPVSFAVHLDCPVSDGGAIRFALGVACENPLSARAKRKHLKCLPAAASLHAGHGKPGHAVGSLAQQSRNGFIWNMSLDDIALDSRRVACGLRDV